MGICLLVFLWQSGDGRRHADAMRYYAGSTLPALELPAYVAEVGSRKPAQVAPALTRAMQQRQLAIVAEAMEHDRDFMSRLRGGQIVTPGHPRYATWQAQRGQYDALRARIVTERYALDSQQPTAVTLLTHMFMHGNWGHLLGNMAVLFIVGYTVELALGPWRYLAFYLLGGLGATVVDLIRAQPGLDIGASGAISAVMAMYAVLFGLRKTRFFYFVFVYFNTARWPALAVLPVWIANELFQYATANANNHVNFLAHFAGLVSGALLAAAYRWRRTRGAASDADDEAALATAQQLRAQAERWFDAGEYARAARQYAGLVAAGPRDTDLLTAYFQAARLAPEHLADAVAALLRRAADGAGAVSGQQVADALHEAAQRRLSLPSLGLTQWATLARLTIDAGRFELAERLVFMLARKRSDLIPPLLQRLARALRNDGRIAQAERLENMIATLNGRSAPGATTPSA